MEAKAASEQVVELRKVLEELGERLGKQATVATQTDGEADTVQERHEQTVEELCKLEQARALP